MIAHPQKKGKNRQHLAISDCRPGRQHFVSLLLLIALNNSSATVLWLCLIQIGGG
jgi:hypothetical protein